MARLAARAYSDNEYPVHQREGIRHALMDYTAPFNLTGRPRCYSSYVSQGWPLARGPADRRSRGHDNEVIEAVIEIERCNAESKNLEDDKDGRDGTKNKPNPV
jgi:hypothetical protein